MFLTNISHSPLLSSFPYSSKFVKRSFTTQKDLSKIAENSFLKSKDFQDEAKIDQEKVIIKVGKVKTQFNVTKISPIVKNKPIDKCRQKLLDNGWIYETEPHDEDPVNKLELWK